MDGLLETGGGPDIQWLDTFEIPFPSAIDFETLQDHWLHFRHWNLLARQKFPDVKHLPSIRADRSPWQDAFDAVFRNLLDWEICCLDITSLHERDPKGFFRILRQHDRFVIGRCLVDEDDDEFTRTLEAIRHREGCDPDRGALVLGFFAQVETGSSSPPKLTGESESRATISARTQ